MQLVSIGVILGSTEKNLHVSLFQKVDTTGKTGCLSISPKTKFKIFIVFADKDENPESPGPDLDYTFSEQNGKSTVRITIYNESPDRMENMIELGFKEGFTTSMTNLINRIATLSQK